MAGFPEAASRTVRRFLKPRTALFAGLAGVDAYWRHRENPEAGWLGIAGRMAAEVAVFDLAGRAIWPVMGALVLPSLVSAGAEYYNARRIERYFTMGAPNLGGAYSNFQMSPTAFQMHSQGLSQIRESRRMLGATLGNEAAYYARRR